ncbi:hypothetical protein [Stenotrophomonas sp. ZAC14A_NAIMI4_1]|uniref:hypothetical protein n=1 Tax=Stenotrophomonas sp. ZAC14A_NAIMI4_1 TaxID=2072412 RepID=UPI0020B16A19|nr:hypothetical protein [Stenotrophomonas sp. ZAC14A_NAIMI4_1]
MALTLIALLLVEVLLLVRWAPFFFGTGLALFNQRIAASPAQLAQLSLGGLEHDLPDEKWMRLVFHALPDGSVAFRESYAPHFGGRYFPLLRGQLVVDTRRREMRGDWSMQLVRAGVYRDAAADRPGAPDGVADGGVPAGVLHGVLHPAAALCRRC